MRTRFGSFTLDADARQLLEEQREIHLSPKAFDVLRLLVEARPGVVDKAAIHARIWPGTFVVDANLSVLIGEIRRALRDTPQDEHFIRTIHRIGYAFCGLAAEVHPDPTPASQPSALGTPAPGHGRCWLVWNERHLLLGPGEHLIGRDPGCAVWIDASGVSRRHACLRIEADGLGASIVDVGSTNGTLLGGSPIDGRRALADGDLIQVGAAELAFRSWLGGAPATERIRR